ncbi:NADH-quinone oxidoreductase subunit C/D [Marinobacterium nitratireducens]|uniref:NADH-quinone oxidoreductase subunit C/D n=1 Tax=Marinobacterium nitratireducens TaxID=518897 RepID=UPI001664A9CE|nr:NADH-quinone oxidoreductase subunit C/D [Marinobacterium nitratireducens]
MDTVRSSPEHVESPHSSLEVLRSAAPGLVGQRTADGIETCWVPRDQLRALLGAAQRQAFEMLFDLTAIDERVREHRQEQPAADFSVVYQLLSVSRNRDLRVKVALLEEDLTLPSICDLWPNANWYECEVWDLFGIRFDGHPHLRRILLPPTWEGHPLRKDHYARATEVDPFSLDAARQDREQEALKFCPEDWGMQRQSDDSDFMFLNLGPNHPSVHGVFRVALQLDGEEIVQAVPDIGYHHRGAEKMGERQAWHSYIPYTDRIDYLGGVMNNLPYVLAVEKLAGIEVPARAQCIRVMMSELFRIASHLVFYGTFAQDVGQMSPVFYMFADRERLFGIVEAITGGRMHPAWFRIGGVAQDLPRGWERMIREFIDYLPARLDEYDSMVLDNRTLKRRTRGIGVYSSAEGLAWGASGPGLRATGLDWDLRRKRPYSGYEQYDFEVVTASGGDCYDRAWVRAEEIRQSLRIVRQCLDHMPAGDYKARHPLTTPPPKDRTLEDIETLIQHFVNSSWGPVIPPGEAAVAVEATKGMNAYYLISDGGTLSYRTRIRTPSFPHLQMIPLMSRGLFVSDLIAIIASIDFVMADVDR